jgi:hypothetical protein
MGLSENRVPQKNNGFFWFMTVHTYFYLLKKKKHLRGMHDFPFRVKPPGQDLVHTGAQVCQLALVSYP